MPFLPVNLKKFAFVEREKINGKYQYNKCGRDFLYYCLHYYYPKKFNSESLNPKEIENNYLFGLKVPFYLAWTMLPFIKMPRFIKSERLVLKINDEKVDTFLSFIKAILAPNRNGADKAIKEIERAVDKKLASGIDINLKYIFLNHVIFVYGYDKNNLYVFDTLPVKGLEYKKITSDDHYIMKLPKHIIKKHWSIFGRIWIISKK